MSAYGGQKTALSGSLKLELESCTLLNLGTGIELWSFSTAEWSLQVPFLLFRGEFLRYPRESCCFPAIDTLDSSYLFACVHLVIVGK